MNYIHFILFLLITSSGFGQLKLFMDIPKVDGEYNVNSPKRNSKTALPKTFCTPISDYTFTNSKTIYLNDLQAIERKNKVSAFQSIEINMFIDKSVTEWHDRIFEGTVLPSLDIFVDRLEEGSGALINEISHQRLFNVRVSSLSYQGSSSKPTLRVILNYEKIIQAYSNFNASGVLTTVSQTCYDLKTGLPCINSI